MTDGEINAAFDRKVRRGMFAPVARHLTNDVSAEDALQDAIAQTWWMYRRYAKDKGTVLDDGILVHSCRQRAVDLARRFVGSDGASCRNQDVLDPRCFRDGRAVVYRIDGIDDDSGESDRALEVGLAEAMAASPARKIRSAIDLRRWLGTLSGTDRFIVRRKWLGYSTTQIAADLSLSHSTVHAKLRTLGLELAARACVQIDFSRERRGRRRSQPTAGPMTTHLATSRVSCP